MKKGAALFLLTSAAASIISINTYAVGNGFYIGLMMGPATNNGGTQLVQQNDNNFVSTINAKCGNPPSPNCSVQPVLIPANPKSSQFGSSFYMGNQFSRYAAVEGGFTYYTSVNYDTKNQQACSGVSARVRDIHVLGKGILPIGNSFDVHAKGGVAVVYSTTSGAFNPEFGTDGVGNYISCGKNTYNNKFSPMYGLGASYAINQSWVTDASWTRTQVGGVLNSVDLFALGLSYHFVDRYCGQFLCDE